MSEKDQKKCKVEEYRLTGPQVQPDASYWSFCSHLHIVKIEELLAKTDDPDKAEFFPPYPDPCTPEGKEQIKEEFAELVDLMKRRDDPCSLVNASTKNGKGAYHPVCVFGDPGAELPKDYKFRAPISRLFNLMPQALGAVVLNRYPGEQIIRTGRGLARAVESETPGIFHRHALNYLMATRQWSPPRQALIWAALDVTIASALQAAWYYKWIGREVDLDGQHPLDLTARRERPSEYAARNGLPFDVLYDQPDELNPAWTVCPDARPCNNGKVDPYAPLPDTKAGTPRHPAYPSGHSTFCGAASEFLKFFFGNDPVPKFLLAFNTPGARDDDPGNPLTIGEELDNMAENIGLGRMWAGVHWRSDHEAGRKLGRVVACLVLQQLADMGAIERETDKVVNFDLCPPSRPRVVDPCVCGDEVEDCPTTDPREEWSREILQEQADAIQAACADDKELQPPCGTSDDDPHKTLDINRSVQQGAL